MGLDMFDMVFTLEQRFGVRIHPADVAQVRTVADLSAVVITLLPRRPADDACPTARTFYELRRLMMTARVADRSAIRPGTALACLFPPRFAHRWRSLCRRDHRLPPLVTSPRADRALLWITGTAVFATVGMAGALFATMDEGLATIFSLVGAGLVFLVIRTIGNRLEVHFPWHAQTMGDLARALAPIVVPAEAGGARLIAQGRVLDEVRRIVSDCLAVPYGEVKAESRLVEDLGAE